MSLTLIAQRPPSGATPQQWRLRQLSLLVAFSGIASVATLVPASLAYFRFGGMGAVLIALGMATAAALAVFVVLLDELLFSRGVVLSERLRFGVLVALGFAALGTTLVGAGWALFSLAVTLLTGGKMDFRS